jgi:hypothetical protein
LKPRPVSSRNHLDAPFLILELQRRILEVIYILPHVVYWVAAIEERWRENKYGFYKLCGGTFLQVIIIIKHTHTTFWQ